jgi:RNA polymerase sigma-70 factor (ECF subfamily)
MVDKQEAFVRAIDENKGLIYKIAALYTNSTEDREDLVQEIIFQLWKSFDSFSRQSSFSTWLYRVAMNTAIYHLRTSKKRIKSLPLEEHLLGQPALEEGEVEQKWRELRKHIEQLNLLDRGIVLLYLENRSYEEIAQVIGISPSNVGTRLSRIKEKMRKQISKE